MQVFIGWSGDLSHRVALSLREWLQVSLQPVSVFVSSEDIEKGARWSTELAGVLEASSFGIFCIVPGNARAPWLNFEAGAVSKVVPSSRVATFLLGVAPTDIQDAPLAQFQATTYTRADMFHLVEAINAARQEHRLESALLKTIFDGWWSKLEAQLDPLRVEAASVPVKAEPDRQYASEVESRFEEATNDWWQHRAITLDVTLFRHIAVNLGDFALTDRRLGVLAVCAAYYGEELGRFAGVARSNPVVIQALAELFASHLYPNPAWRAAAILERCEERLLSEAVQAALQRPLVDEERRLLLETVVPNGSTWQHIEEFIRSASSDNERDKARQVLMRLKVQLGERERAHA